MSEIKVDFLLKDELTYELWCRGVTIPENETVDRLRKLLRHSIKNNLDYSHKNLRDKITLVNEIELIKKKVSEIQTNYDDLNSESRIQDIVRAENKIYHSMSRIENLSKFQISEENNNELKSQSEILTKYVNKLKSLSLKDNVKELFIRKISDSHIEEEQFIDMTDQFVLNNGEQSDNVFLNNNEIVKVESENLLSQSNPKQISSVSPAFDSNLYNKLPNPIEKYLSALKFTDGLNVGDLLLFISVMLKLKRETQLSVEQICDLLIGNCHGPLLNKMLSFKQMGLNIFQINECIINSFIPRNMLDNLRMQHVNRPQKSNEPISIYIDYVKQHSDILMCKLTELEVVNIIKMGLNPETRSKLTFTSDPKTFADLDSMCIHYNNVNYLDYTRYNQVEPTVARMQAPRHGRDAVQCHNCGRRGHISRNCFGVRQSSSFPKNL